MFLVPRRLRPRRPLGRARASIGRGPSPSLPSRSSRPPRPPAGIRSGNRPSRCHIRSISAFALPKPFFRPSPPSEGGWRGGDGAGRRTSSPRRVGEPAAWLRRGGPMYVCVRICDGSFFPLPYSRASGARLKDICQALCPNTKVELFSMPFGGTVDQSASLTGARYSASRTP